MSDRTDPSDPAEEDDRPIASVTRLPVDFRETTVTDELPRFVTALSKCAHPSFVVDPAANVVRCTGCQEDLNPMWVLKRLADDEARQLRNRAVRRAELARLEERSSTKCRHCDRMTPISRS